MYKTWYGFVQSRDIFGMVGRCGGGHNTIWEDWSPQGRSARECIITEFEAGMDALCGHYSKLLASITAEGIRNPLILTCGLPRRREIKYLPPELREQPPETLLLLESLSGASRLWAAQQLGIPVPAFVNDWTGKFNQLGFTEISTIDEAQRAYRDQPTVLKFDSKLGLVEGFDQQKVGYHLGPEWREDRLVPHRAPLWVSIMNRYGYRVDRLPAFVEEILAQAGIVQPPAQ